MTGPEHYRTAEEFLTRAGANDDPADLESGWAAEALIAAAQVHATLALAAASGLHWVVPEDAEAWREVASATAKAGPS